MRVLDKLSMASVAGKLIGGQLSCFLYSSLLKYRLQWPYDLPEPLQVHCHQLLLLPGALHFSL